MPFRNKYDVVILGAGAAGLMCAIESGKRGRSTLLLDHAKKPAEKIRISGGGRCNFTNLNTNPQAFISENPHFCKSALKQYTQHDFIAMVESYGIPYHEKTLGQLFCDTTAKDIINMLLNECKKYGIDLFLETSISKVEKNDTYKIQTTRGAVECSSLVIATGGPSIPKMGATGFAYDIAKQFGLNMIEPCAALVPFTFEMPHLEFYKSLAGVALSARARLNKQEFDEAVLFTHRGLSGPAALQISSYWDHSSPIHFDLKPDDDIHDYLKVQKNENPRKNIDNILSQIIPSRLAEKICERLDLSGNIAELSNDNLQQISDHINNWSITPDGTEGYRTAEVTRGGIDTDELSSKTMESKKYPGLYFIGECVDVTGWLGGYNFQWAWSSGYVAGQNV